MRGGPGGDQGRSRAGLGEIRGRSGAGPRAVRDDPGAVRGRSGAVTVAPGRGCPPAPYVERAGAAGRERRKVSGEVRKGGGCCGDGASLSPWAALRWARLGRTGLSSALIGFQCRLRGGEESGGRVG